jgi:hypothetical protein
MGLFLQMVGAVFIGLMLVVIATYVWIRWKLKGWTDNISAKLEKFGKVFNPAGIALANVPPMRIKLNPATLDEAAHAVDLQRMSTELEGLGFRRGELYSLEGAGMLCQALFHPNERVDGLVYDHSFAGVWIDFDLRFADGTSLCYSNSPQGSTLDHPPGHDIRHFPGEQVAVLWERFQHDLPSKLRANSDAAGFVQRFEEGYREEMDWRISRGGVTIEEIRRTVAQGGDDDASEELISMIQTAWHMRIAQHLDEQLREAFLQGGAMSLAEYESTRDRLVFVHDRTSPDQLQIYLKPEFAQVVMESGGDDDDGPADMFHRDTKLHQRCRASSPRVVFRELLESRQLRGRYRFVKEMASPVAADVYVVSRDAMDY